MLYWLWLALKRGLSNAKKQTILQLFATPQDVYYADASAYAPLEELKRFELDALLDKDLEEAKRVLAQCYEKGITIVTMQDAIYPGKLKAIYDPPIVLYCKGKLPVLDAVPSIGVVGTRSATGYGKKIAKRIGYQLGIGGAVVISGGAVGIDTMAMKGALSAGAPVIGVMATGLDIAYPLCNRDLYEDLTEHGCLVSELIPGTSPTRGGFPRRNRLISGLSDGVLIVEAPRRSGALITARCALEQGRDIFAVPGDIGSDASVGCNELIRDGAMLTQMGWDILQEYVHRYPNQIRRFQGGTKMTLTPEEQKEKQPPVRKEKETSSPENDKNSVDNDKQNVYIDLQEVLDKVTPSQAKILRALEHGPDVTDNLAQLCQIPAADLLADFTMLEIEGYIERLPGNRFGLAKK